MTHRFVRPRHCPQCGRVWPTLAGEPPECPRCKAEKRAEAWSRVVKWEDTRILDDEGFDHWMDLGGAE